MTGHEPFYADYPAYQEAEPLTGHHPHHQHSHQHAITRSNTSVAPVSLDATTHTPGIYLYGFWLQDFQVRRKRIAEGISIFDRRTRSIAVRIFEESIILKNKTTAIFIYINVCPKLWYVIYTQSQIFFDSAVIYTSTKCVWKKSIDYLNWAIYYNYKRRELKGSSRKYILIFFSTAINFEA